ncbi:MAG: SAM-dependent methyltransferase [Bacteroidota bacterium]
MSVQTINHPSSYRDPSGFIFEKAGILYRQVNTIFKDDFDFFINSGCYKKLIEKKWLIPHETIKENLTGTPDYYLTLKPEKVDFVSYPYEWSFDMLKDAALLTLQLVKEAVSFELILKDATPYNIQWYKGKLVFIDTLSFEKYNEAEPWIAYRQFCQNFLGPLLLMHYSKKPLQQLLLAYPEGIPLDIVSGLLPAKSRLSLYTYLHIHLHAKISSAKNNKTHQRQTFSKQKLLNLINSLESLITRLTIPYQQSTWSEYYSEAAKRTNYITEKKKIIELWVDQLPGIKKAADLGANDGEFSKLAAGKNIAVIAADFDPWCINNLYREIKSSGIKNIQPLIIDLSNPSPSIGVNNAERDSFIKRCKADLVLALALIHHLVIGKNIPFEKVANFFSTAGNNLVIEFVPKKDEKVELMLKDKKDIYTTYNQQAFLTAFEKYFSVVDRKIIGNTNRVLFLMKKISQ